MLSIMYIHNTIHFLTGNTQKKVCEFISCWFSFIRNNIYLIKYKLFLYNIRQTIQIEVYYSLRLFNIM